MLTQNLRLGKEEKRKCSLRKKKSDKKKNLDEENMNSSSCRDSRGGAGAGKGGNEFLLTGLFFQPKKM